jgi:hypothetical protein
MKYFRIGITTLLAIGLLHGALDSKARMPSSIGAQDQKQAELSDFFKKYAGLNDEQIASIRNGQPVAKIMDSPTADEVFVIGAIFVRCTPEDYLKMASNIDALRKLPSYLAIRKFSDPPQLSDLDGFSLDEEDVKSLQKCHEGKCEVQLPTEAMDEFHSKVNWSAPDVADQVNRVAKEMALEGLRRYQQGGNAALGTYRDKNNPAAIEQAFHSLISRSKALPVYLPALHSYLLNYPKAKSDHIQSQFYWEKVNFGLKPTIRVLQAVVYQGTDSVEPSYAIAIKQLYASHYFETALDLTVCIREDEGDRHGTYLITLKGSDQAGLTGFKGSIVRKVAVDKTRSSLEKALAAMKVTLESGSH